MRIRPARVGRGAVIRGLGRLREGEGSGRTARSRRRELRITMRRGGGEGELANGARSAQSQPAAGGRRGCVQDAAGRAGSVIVARVMVARILAAVRTGGA